MVAALLATMLAPPASDEGMKEIMRLFVSMRTPISRSSTSDALVEGRAEAWRRAADKKLTEIVTKLSNRSDSELRSVIRIIDYAINGDPKRGRSDQSKTVAKAQIQWLLDKEGSTDPVQQVSNAVAIMNRILFECDVLDKAEEITSAVTLYNRQSLVLRGDVFNRQDPVVFRDGYWAVGSILPGFGGTGIVEDIPLKEFNYYANRFKRRKF